MIYEISQSVTTLCVNLWCTSEDPFNMCTCVKTHYLIQVVAVDLNHHFLNKEEYFHKFVYAADIHYFRTSVNIFSEEEATIKKVILHENVHA